MKIRKKVNDIALRSPGTIAFYRSIVRLFNSQYRKKHVAMFHIGRCGSTVLGMMLNQNSYISWGGEVFHRFMDVEKEQNGNAEKFVAHEIDWSSSASVSRIFGFETKYLPSQHLAQRCIDLPLIEYIELLKTMGVVDFIVLQRRNYLRRTISAEIGRKKKIWHSKNKAGQPEKIILNISSIATGETEDHLLDLFRCIDTNFIKIKNLLASDNTLFLTYEEDIMTNPQIAYEKVCAFLDIPAEKTAVQIFRTNPYAYEEMIDNFDEVSQLLKDTEYEWMLSD